MFHGPTELLWIGCLTELILILKPNFDALTTNINSQTFLTKGNFTRDEWSNLLHLLNISHFSSTCFAQNFSVTSCTKTMAKSMQEQEGQERCVTTSKSIYSDELVFSCSDKFLILEKSHCIQKSGDTHSHNETRKRDEKKFKIRRSVEFSCVWKMHTKVG